MATSKIIQYRTFGDNGAFEVIFDNGVNLTRSNNGKFELSLTTESAVIDSYFLEGLKQIIDENYIIVNIKKEEEKVI